MKQKYSIRGSTDESYFFEIQRPYSRLFIGCERVLDIGCERGVFLKCLKELNIECDGIDYDSEIVEYCVSEGLNVKQGNVRDKDFEIEKDKYDGIYLGHIIEHLNGDEFISLMEKISNSIKDNGRLVIVTPNYENEYVRDKLFWEDHTHVRPYPMQLIIKILNDLDFSIIQNEASQRCENREFFVVSLKGREIEENLKCKVNLHGTFFEYNSIPNINREIAIQLSNNKSIELFCSPFELPNFNSGIDNRFEKIEECIFKKRNNIYDVTINYRYPPSFDPPPIGHFVISQPWEFGIIPDGWTEKINNNCDELWTTSTISRNMFISSGVNKNIIFIIPCGFNEKIFDNYESDLSSITNKKFKFLYVGDLSQRKSPDLVLEAYCNSFNRKDDVSLIIKTNNSKIFPNRYLIIDKIREVQNNKNYPEIIFIDESISDQEMVYLYSGCNCLLAPYRGEGFCMPVLEAMACGLPVITTKGGATDDWCNDSNSTRVSSRIELINFRKKVGWLLEPDIDELKFRIKDIFKNNKEYRKKAKIAYKEVRESHTWNHIGKIIEERIKLLIIKPIRRKSAIRIEYQNDCILESNKLKLEIDEFIEGNDINTKELLKKGIKWERE